MATLRNSSPPWFGRTLCSVLLAMPWGIALAGPVTNNDIIKLLEAGMQEDVILQVIAAGEPRFDSSATALVRLKEKGATPAILKAVLSPKSVAAPAGRAVTSTQPTGRMSPVQQAQPAAGLNPEELIVVQDGQESTMQSIIPTVRGAARALGLGGVAVYASLQGPSAQKRIAASNPQFIISVPRNAQPNGYLTLANFAVRPNGTREVLVGGGFMSFTSGVHKDRVIPIQTETLQDQSRAREGFILYKMTPAHILAKGEYAVILTTGNSFFDFGVD